MIAIDDPNHHRVRHEIMHSADPSALFVDRSGDLDQTLVSKKREVGHNLADLLRSWCMVSDTSTSQVATPTLVLLVSEFVMRLEGGI